LWNGVTNGNLTSLWVSAAICKCGSLWVSAAVWKCGSLLITGNSKSVNNIADTELAIRDSKLVCLESVKDLGVIVDSRLMFTEHIDSMISRAKQRVYLLFKSFTNRNVILMVFAFKVYILPILDYCSSIWSPVKLGDIDRIESVQRAFTKRLKGLKLKSYNERLVSCNLPSLELRRLRNDLILCYKIIHKIIALDFNDFFEFEVSKFNTRGHKFKLRLPKCNNNLRKFFFSIRIIPVWNGLPDLIVNSSSVLVFKKLLNSVDLSKFLLRNHDSV